MTPRARLLIIAPKPVETDPGQRYRFEQYLDVWREAGIDVRVEPLLTRDEQALLHARGAVLRKILLVARCAVRRSRHIAAARRFDAVLVFREAFPIGPPVFEWLLGVMRVPFILDFDDAIWIPATRDENRAFRWLKFSMKTAAIARRARLVTVGNQYLADWVRGYNDEVRILPTTIDTDVYDRPEPPVRTGTVCVGWTGSVTTVAHLRTVEPVLREIQQSDGVRLRVIGDPDYRLPGADVEVLPWRAETEVADLEPVDIGIMPLPDDEWTRGKCGLKALQYMALGIPAVMSPVGVNVEIADGGAALLADAHAEWKDALRRLAADPALRREIGARGRAVVAERYSKRVVAPRWVDAVRSIVGDQAVEERKNIA